jgi:alkaline phosphatase
MNRDVNNYMQEAAGLEVSLQELSDRLFVKHDQVFAGMNFTIDKKNPDFPLLRVKKGKNILEVKAFSSVATMNGKPFDIGSVTVYIDKNNTFYLPSALAEKL